MATVGNVRPMSASINVMTPRRDDTSGKRAYRKLTFSEPKQPVSDMVADRLGATHLPVMPAQYPGSRSLGDDSAVESCGGEHGKCSLGTYWHRLRNGSLKRDAIP